MRLEKTDDTQRSFGHQRIEMLFIGESEKMHKLGILEAQQTARTTDIEYALYPTAELKKHQQQGLLERSS